MELATDSIAAKVSNWWKNWLETNQQMDELRSLGYEDLESVAADCGVSTTQLISIVRAGPHATDEMLAMMKALNIDAAAVQANDPHLFHDMQVVCAECESKGRCRKHLADGSAASTYAGYCGNAPLMNELRAEPEMLVE
ncbi:DUF6455 family protein [Rhizobium alvei]|uniref:DUF6455 family protein n=1 Tax=Rhizobium alvei TaxID=1132659 RepID=A0ABT8YJD8_9HYPH|nr:DUF6455 family protein [Rhizobium alvei]MDO6963814.1 DUF6455 family protein [Rhizobium alvei]